MLFHFPQLLTLYLKKILARLHCFNYTRVVVSGLAISASLGKLIRNANSDSWIRNSSTDLRDLLSQAFQEILMPSQMWEPLFWIFSHTLTLVQTQMLSLSVNHFFSLLQLHSHFSFIHWVKLLPLSHKLYHFLKHRYFWKDQRIVYNHPLKFPCLTVF